MIINFLQKNVGQNVGCLATKVNSETITENDDSMISEICSKVKQNFMLMTLIVFLNLSYSSLT